METENISAVPEDDIAASAKVFALPELLERILLHLPLLDLLFAHRISRHFQAIMLSSTAIHRVLTSELHPAPIRQWAAIVEADRRRGPAFFSSFPAIFVVRREGEGRVNPILTRFLLYNGRRHRGRSMRKRNA